MIELNDKLTIMLDGFELKTKGTVIESFNSKYNNDEQHLIIQLISGDNIYHIFAIYNKINSTFTTNLINLLRNNEIISQYKNFEIDF